MLHASSFLARPVLVCRLCLGVLLVWGFVSRVLKMRVGLCCCILLPRCLRLVPVTLPRFREVVLLLQWGAFPLKKTWVVFSSFTLSLTTTPRSGPGLTGVQFLRTWATLGFCDHLHGILFVIRDCFKSGLLGQSAI